MKTISISLLLFFCLVFVAQVNGQDSTKIPVYDFVEQNPEFPGGDIALMNFIQQNISYPQYERDNNIQGKVIAKVVILEDGSIGDIKLLRTVSPGIDAEAERVIKLLPKFKPAFHQGKPMRVYYSMPVVFRL